MADDKQTLLTEFQVKVARLFFSLSASEGFLLAGGGALLAQGLTARPTRDLDFFTRPGAGDVREARDEFVVAAEHCGWDVELGRDGPTYCRLTVRGAEDPQPLELDLAVDSGPSQPPSASIVGPTFAPAELAGRKVVALFDRAADRDFVDVFALSARFDKTSLLDLARQLDAGFNVRVFVEMIDMLNKYQDVDLEQGEVDVPALRAFFRQWRAELAGSGEALGGDQ